MRSELDIGDRAIDTWVLYAGMVVAGLVFVSSLVLPLSPEASGTVATLSFGVMSGLWLAHLAYEVLTGSAEVRKANLRRLVRTYTMIAAVSSVSLLVFGQQFAGDRLAVASVAVGTVAFVSVIMGALVAGVQYLGEEVPVEDAERPAD